MAINSAIVRVGVLCAVVLLIQTEPINVELLLGWRTSFAVSSLTERSLARLVASLPHDIYVRVVMRQLVRELKSGTLAVAHTSHESI